MGYCGGCQCGNGGGQCGNSVGCQCGNAAGDVNVRILWGMYVWGTGVGGCQCGNTVRCKCGNTVGGSIWEDCGGVIVEIL